MRHNSHLRRAALRAMFGVTLFAATGAAPSHASAAAHQRTPAAHVAPAAR